MLLPDATCANIDECTSGKPICPYNRRCVNTFGSYYCKCHIGFELKYLHGRYACVVIPENSVKEILRAPGTIKDRIKKLLAHKNILKKKAKTKNVILEPTGIPTSQVNLRPFHYEEGVPHGRNSKGDKKDSKERMKERPGEEERAEKGLENDVEREQSLRGDVFSPKVNEADELGLVLVQRKALTSKLEPKATLNISVDCSFDHGVCDWKQDGEDDFDWNLTDRDNALGYYLAVPALAGHKKDIGRLKLLLPDLQPQSNFCLLFDYRLAGDKVGKLRVFVKNSNSALAWEETRSEDDRWKTGKIPLYQGIDTAKSIIFEAERGKGKTGEIAVDCVWLVSGFCPDGLFSADQ
ncbi:Epidermal growth factor-like protein 6 [Tupaia chinensis]|uniref:Epidermal growth factor-like protein 6 n=1 Tax=Tupaia chinensis TaxID=246437 RepID=L8Y2L3_TUPCH|nr:Epidermal growth factor-like protein 6 [Tupaia chinensis]